MGLTTATTTPAQIAAARIREIDAAMLANMQAALVESFNTFWNNAQGATPQEIAAVLGPDCTFGFQMHVYFVNGVITVTTHDGLPVDVPTSIPPGWMYSVAADGTMILTPPPAVSYRVTVLAPPAPPPASGPLPIVTGTSCAVMVEAIDVSGQVVSGYNGTAAITCTDAAATLPNPATIAFVAGQTTFQVTFGTAGTETVTLTNSTTSTLTGNAQVTVQTPA